MESIIRINGLGKVFSDGWGRRDSIALVELSLEVCKGQVIGVFGGNGSGKSTLLKLLCGLITPTSGRVEILGKSPIQAVGGNCIGYVAERPAIPAHLTPVKFLKLCGQLSGLSGEFLDTRMQNCIESCFLDRHCNTATSKLSKGVVQRLALAQALVHDPDLLLLDEPVDGLDPLAREEVEALFKSLKNTGKTLLISTHLLEGLEGLCDQVLVLDEGHAIYWGPPHFEKGMQAWVLNHLKEKALVNA